MASTRVRIATFDRYPIYVSTGPPPSSLPPVCVKVVDVPEISMDSSTVDTDVEELNAHSCRRE